MNTTYEQWILHMNNANYIWTMNTTYEQWILHMNNGYCIWTMNTTYEQWILHMNNEYYIWTMNTTYEQWILHMNNEQHIWTMNTTYEQWILHMNNEYYIWTMNTTHEHTRLSQSYIHVHNINQYIWSNLPQWVWWMHKHIPRLPTINLPCHRGTPGIPRSCRRHRSCTLQYPHSFLKPISNAQLF